MKQFLPHHAKDGFGIFQCGGIAADHEHQLALLRAPVAAGNGRIQKTHTAFGAGRGNLAGERRRDRAGVHVNAAAFERLHGAAGSPEDFLEGGRITNHGEKEVSGRGDILRGFCKRRAGGHEFVGTRSGAIPDGERMAGLDEIHAHGAAHQTETNESNFSGSASGFQRVPPQSGVRAPHSYSAQKRK